VDNMNNKGQGLLMAVVIAVMIFTVGMLFMQFLKSDITDARSPIGLDCQNSTISDGNKVTCLGVDIVIPYFIITVISAAGGIIISRFLL